MAVYDKKSIAHTRTLENRGQRVDHDSAARIQRRAERLTELVENSNNTIGAEFAKRHRQGIELQMAQLRSDAVQARRLAEQVESLSRRTTDRIWKRTMTESSIFDTGNHQHQRPERKDKPSTAKGALAFNPLHPSMELPPEQLIRLLGMESKKTRKHMKVRRSSPRQEPPAPIVEEKIPPSPPPVDTCAPAEAQEPQRSDEPQQSHPRVAKHTTRRTANPAPIQGLEMKPEKKPVTKSDLRSQTKSERGSQNKKAVRPTGAGPEKPLRPAHPMEYERSQPAVIEQKRIPGWLLPSLVTGVVAGAVIAAALLLFQSPPITEPRTPDRVAASESRKSRIPGKPASGQQLPRKTAVDTSKSAAPRRQSPAPQKAARSVDEAKLQTAIKTEQKRLRRAAEQRLAEQMTKMKVSRELADLPPPPSDQPQPRMATTQTAPTERTLQPTAPSEPVPAAVTPALAHETSAAPPAAGLSPLEHTGSDRTSEISGETNDLIGDTAQDTASVAAPGDTADVISNSAPVSDVKTMPTSDYTHEPATVTDSNKAVDSDSATEQTGPGLTDESPSSAAKDSALF